MSREIKFRAWDKDENRMIHSGTEQNDYPFSWHIHNTGIEIVEYDGTDWNPLKNIKLMQYTGLKDKNGTEIYEGDILKMHQFLFDGNEYEKETIGVIKWGEYGWLLSQIDGKEVNEYMGYKNGEGETYLIHFYGLHEESFEVIGNIYENAELLK